ncbi:MAG: hypothetical protein K2M95_02855, partial [Clostridiales bacterium]|nr:hypothetical protein [Clostridiales bacterium]
MSTYDLYKQKMQKLAAIKNTIVRFRVLIISVLAAVIALVFTLLGIKGIFTQDLTLKASDLIYGDAIVFETPAKAIMSNVFYEYAEDGSDSWSRQKPTRPGTYSVRAVAKGGFGKKYGKAAQFTISRRAAALSIADESLVYGDDPTGITADILPSDTLVKGELEFVFADYAASETDVTIVPDSVKIVNASGEDVTACYTLTLPQVSVRVAQRSVTVAPQDFASTYCGTPIAYEKKASPSTLAALGNGDTITFETQVVDDFGAPVSGGQMPKNAGRYAVAIMQDTVRILHGSTDVTHQYAFAFARGTFTIRPREITVTPQLMSTDYDGREHSFAGGYEIVSGDVLAADKAILEKAHKARYTGRTADGDRVENALSVTEAGTYSIVLIPDALTNYTVTDSKAGSFTLRPRELHVRTLDFVKPYDGTPLYGRSESYDAGKVLLQGSLVSTHRFTALEAEATYITDVQSSGAQNKTPYRVVDSANRNKTYNYNIVYDKYGALTISRAKLTLRPSMNTGSVTYDGAVHAYGGGYEIDSGAVYSALSLKAYFTGMTAGNTTLTLADKAEYVVHAGAYALLFDEAFVAANNPNYEISFATGAFTVSKVSVVITTGSGSKPYDGTALSAGDAGVTAPSPNRMLPDRHTIKIVRESIAYSFITVADTLNMTNNNVHACRIENGREEDVSFDFDISYVYGTLTINKRPVMLVPVVTGAGVQNVFGGYTKVYDGTMPDFGYVALYALETDAPNGGAFVGNEEDTYVPSFIVTSLLGKLLPHVDSYTVQIEMPGEALCQNYVFSLSSCTLTVTAYAATVYTGSGSKTYDGAPMHALSNGVSAPSATLPQGHTLEIDATTLSEISHVTDTYANNNVHACHVLNEANEVVDDDFVFTYVYGTLTIMPRSVEITPDITQVNGVDISGKLNNGAVVYDGYLYDRFGYTAVNLANGETLDNRCVAYVRGTLASGGTCTRGIFVYAAGDYTVFFDKAELESAFTDYTFTVNEAAFVIRQREITVTTADASFTYNGQAQYTYGYTLTNGSLVGGHKLVADIENVSTVTHVSDTKAGNNETKFLVVGAAEDENNHSSEIHYNYKIEYVCGTLTVTPRSVSIKPLNNCTKEYDGKPYTYPNATDNFIDVGKALLDGDTLTVSVSFEGALSGGKPIDAGNYTISINEPIAKAFTSGGVGQFGDYTFDYTGTDTLVIARRAISIRPKDDTKEYDGEEYDYLTAQGNNAGNFTCVEGSLVAGETLTITAVSYLKGGTSITPVNADSYGIIIVAYAGGGNFKAGNYDTMVDENGTLVISPRVVTVTPYMDPASVEYNATEYAYGGLFTDDNHRILQKDDGMVLHGYFRFTFLDEEQTVNGALHAGEYTIVLDDEQDYPNYKFVDSEAGTFTITKRPILLEFALVDGEKGVVKIDATHYEKEYDGDGVVFADYKSFYRLSGWTVTTEQGLLGDDKLIVSYTAYTSWGVAFPNVAEYVFNPEFFTDENRVVCNDYSCYTLAARLRITQRNVLLVPTVSGESDYTKVYDGEAPEFSYEAVHLDADGNPDGLFGFVPSDEEGYVPSFTATGAMGRSLPHVDEYTVSVDTPSDELCRNYAFTYGTGNLTITPRTVSILPKEDSKVYDGAAYAYPQHEGNFVYAPDSLPFVEYPSEAHVPITLSVSFKDEGGNTVVPVHAGSYLMVITAYVGAIENAYDYNIETSCSATLTVEKRAIVIIVLVLDYDGTPMPDNEKIYDGKGVVYAYKSSLQANEDELGLV